MVIGYVLAKGFTINQTFGVTVQSPSITDEGDSTFTKTSKLL